MVLVPPDDHSVAALGVGCASIMGRVGRRDSLNALAAAYDGGARYLDVARSYGYGGAERVVGEFLHGRRDDCIVATKVGIKPSAPGLVNRVLLPIARSVVARVPGIQKLSARRGPALAGVSKGSFHPDDVVDSLETSLRELATDHVDLLLLHDVELSDLEDDRLLRRLDDALQSGKTRALGIATHVDESVKILRHSQDLPIAIDIVQVPSHIGEPGRSRLFPAVESATEVTTDRFVTTHSSLQLREDARESLVRWLEQHPHRVEPLRDAGLVQGELRADLPRILLGWALAANPEGVTLCGMLKPEHAAANLHTAERVERCADDLLGLGRDWRASLVSRSPDAP
jgi:aryl-alcohol dehydrogenase-like predicted oxidoreductase